MFKMNRTEAAAPKITYLTSEHHQTSMLQAHQQTKLSAQSVAKSNLHTKAGATAFLGCDVDPDVLQVTAKREAKNWKSQQYRDEEHRGQLNVTTNRAVQDNVDIELTEKLRVNQHNIKVTNISEYSNALNRGRVFTNPKFSSC
jgi:hypothetical protein